MSSVALHSNARNDYRLYLPQPFCDAIEERFYSRISEKAKLKNLRKDPNFLKSPAKHVGLYSDHGTVHVRDVARRFLAVVEQTNGLLIPGRPFADLEIMRGLGLHLVYLHDIGMLDFTAYGRFMHPEFAAQFVFDPEFDEILDILWESNAGNIPWLLLTTFPGQPQKRIFRELLSLSVAHSKSKFSMAVLNTPSAMAQHMRRIVSTPLPLLFHQQKVEKLKVDLAFAKKGKKQEKLQKKLEKHETALIDFAKTETPALRFYTKLEEEAYAWLETAPSVFIQNVQDSLRCLRAADALRQRGATLRTSAGYEIFVDQQSANAIFGLREGSNRALYLLETRKALNAGEANLASSEIDRHGDLRVSFHRGDFSNKKVTKRAARNAAVVINDIQGDVIESFLREGVPLPEGWATPSRSFENIRITIEGTDDNPTFAALVAETLADLNPAIEHRLRPCVSLQGADISEVERYLQGTAFASAFPEREQQKKIQQEINDTGVYPLEPDWPFALRAVKVVQLSEGEQLIRAGSPAGFVYIPLQDGLEVRPLGGYRKQPAQAWLPIGNTGVIRGDKRNADVDARQNLQVLMIPKEIFLQYWHIPFSARMLREKWKRKT